MVALGTGQGGGVGREGGITKGGEGLTEVMDVFIISIVVMVSWWVNISKCIRLYTLMCAMYCTSIITQKMFFKRENVKKLCCLLVGKRINELWFTHTREFYAAVKNQWKSSACIKTDNDEKSKLPKKLQCDTYLKFKYTQQHGVFLGYIYVSKA